MSSMHLSNSKLTVDGSNSLAPKLLALCYLILFPDSFRSLTRSPFGELLYDIFLLIFPLDLCSPALHYHFREGL